MVGIDGAILLVVGALLVLIGGAGGFVIRGSANDPGGQQARDSVRNLQRQLGAIREEVEQFEAHPRFDRLRSLVERRGRKRDLQVVTGAKP